MTMQAVTVTPLYWKTLGVDYATINAAVTGIGSTPTVLVVPSGTWPVTAQFFAPATLTWWVMPGGYIDLTALYDGDISAMSKASACQVTTGTTSSIGTNVYVRFYDVRQYYDSGAATTLEWKGLNRMVYQATNVNGTNFTVAANTSAYHTYVNTDPGRVCVPIGIAGEIIAGKQKIFNTTSKAQVIRGLTSTQFYTGLQTEVCPEWFGAVGDDSTDDYIPLMNTVNFLAHPTANTISGEIDLTRQYAVSSTFAIDDFNTDPLKTLIVRGRGQNYTSVIGTTACVGKPVMEVFSSAVELYDFALVGVQTTIGGSQPAHAPSIALLIGSSVVVQGGGLPKFKRMGVYGWYQYGLACNVGTDTAEFEDWLGNAQACTSDATSWTFDYALIGEASLNPFTGLVPTETDYRKYAAYTSNTGGCRFKNMWGGSLGTKASGSAVIYNVKGGGTWEGIASEEGGDYYAYLKDSGGVFRDCGGDGGGSVAAFRLESTSPCNVGITIKNCYSAASPIFISTDSNTTLVNSVVDTISTGGGTSIVLGAGLTYSTFKNMTALTAFTSVVRALYCNIEIPADCLHYSVAINGYGNNIKMAGANGIEQRFDSDIRIGMPGNTDPVTRNLIVEPYKMTWLAAAPTAGSWTQGSVIWNLGAAASGTPGWVCILSNTFGTLNTGNTTATTNSTSTIRLSSLTGIVGDPNHGALQVGDFIDIATATGGPFRVINIDATLRSGTYYNVIVHTAVTNTVTGQAASFHNVTTANAFKAMANLGS